MKLVFKALVKKAGKEDALIKALNDKGYKVAEHSWRYSNVLSIDFEKECKGRATNSIVNSIFPKASQIGEIL